MSSQENNLSEQGMTVEELDSAANMTEQPEASNSFTVEDIDRQEDWKNVAGFLKNSADNYGRGLLSYAAAIPGQVGGIIREQGEKGTSPFAIPSFNDGVALSRDIVNHYREKAGNAPLAGIEDRSMNAVDQFMTDSGKKLKTWNDEQMKRFKLLPTDNSDQAQVAFDLGSGTASVLSSLGILYATRNPAVLFSLFGTMQKGAIYNEAREKGVGVGSASLASNLAGLVEGGTEALGGSAFLKSVSFDRFVTRAVVRSAIEGGQEGIQQGGEEIIAKFFGIRDSSMLDIVKRVGYATALGIVIGAPASVITTHLENSSLTKDFMRMGFSKKDSSKILKHITDRVIESKEVDVALTNFLDVEIKNSQTAIDSYLPEQEKGDAEIHLKELEDLNARLFPPNVSAAMDEVIIQPNIEASEKTLPEVEMKQSEESPGLTDIVSEGRVVGGLQYSVSDGNAYIEDVRTKDAEKGNRYSMAAIQKIIDRPDVDRISGEATAESRSFWEEKYGAEFDERGEFNIDVRELKTATNNSDMSGDDLSVEARKYDSAEEFEESILRTEPLDAYEKLSGYVKELDAGLFGDTEKAGDILAEQETTDKGVEYWKKKISDGDNPIVIVGSYGGPTRVIDGHHRLQAYRELGVKMIPVVFQDDIKDIWIKAHSTTEKLQKLLDAKTAMTAVNVGGLEGLMPPELKKVVRQEVTLIKQRLKDLFTGIKEGKKEALADAKAVQSELISIIDRAEIEPSIKARFLKTIKNIQTPEQFTMLAQEIENRVSALEEAFNVRELRAAIQKELKKTKVKNKAGKPQVKLDMEVQEIMDNLRGIMKLSTEEAEARLQKNLEAENPTEEMALENRLLDMRLKAEQGSSELQEVLTVIRDLKKGGQALNELRLSDIKARRKASVENIVSEVTGKKGLVKGSETVGVQEKKSSFISTITKHLISFPNMMTWITSKLKGVKPGTSYTERFGDVFVQEQSLKAIRMKWIERQRQEYADAYGLKDDAEILRHIARDTHVVSLGTFKNSKGVTVELKMTKAQARKKWMELSDPSLGETFSEGMWFTPEMVRAIRNFLNSKDMAFIQSAQKFYSDFYEEIAPVYEEIYGIRMPRNEKYSPIKREGVVKEDSSIGEFGKEMAFRRSIAPSATKTRQKNIHPLAYTSDMMVQNQHIEEMSHFIAWAVKARELVAVFGSNEVRQAITENYGKDANGVIDGFIQDFISRGKERSSRLGKIGELVDQLRTRATHVALAIRPSITIKQLMSFPAYMEVMTPKEFSSGVADFFDATTGSIKEKIAILKEHPFLKYRSENMDRDIKKVMREDAYKNWRKHQSFINKLMLNVALGDQGAIVVGGWAAYKKGLSDFGGDKKKALDFFARASNSAQQSGDASELSALQRGGPFERLFTMFKSSQNQYMRKEIMALRNAYHGRIPKKELYKQLAIFHVLLPVLFQWASDFFAVRPEKLARAAVMGNLNGLFIVGDFLDMAVQKAFGEKTYGDAESIAAFQVIRDSMTAVSSIDWNDIDEEDVWKAMEGLEGVAAFASRIPLKQIRNMATGTIEGITESDAFKAVGSFLGWGKSTFAEDEE